VCGGKEGTRIMPGRQSEEEEEVAINSLEEGKWVCNV